MSPLTPLEIDHRLLVALRGTALISGAPLASTGRKRLIRRPRAGLRDRAPFVPVRGRRSFPGSRAGSAAAAAVPGALMAWMGVRWMHPLGISAGPAPGGAHG
ncbi:hypothetical protein ACIRPT_16715 [Streptomyces sp. NPDC101227]|uniref:hypothetical protein n=1 Tax=Streptomyces sp. NPDC101227 TaxID=3366136 RepID=UPI0038229527